MNEVIDYTSRSVRISKKFVSEEALIGQIVMNFKTWRDFRVADIEIQNARASFLIHKHYASLYTISNQPYITLERNLNVLEYKEKPGVQHPCFQSILETNSFI